jgi:hypothetical protein
MAIGELPTLRYFVGQIVNLRRIVNPAASPTDKCRKPPSFENPENV